MITRRLRVRVLAIAALAVAPAAASAHSGPPYPIVSSRLVGPYQLSVWSDPDTTDDRSQGGKFWVTLQRADGSGTVPADTQATVAVRARDREQPEERATATPVRGDIGNQFAGLVLDHEGPFAVRVDVRGPLGHVTVNTTVDATYDLRPARWLIVVYLVPFLLVAFLWIKLLMRRHAATRQSG